MRLENWGIVPIQAPPFTPPELWAKAVCGNVYGHPNFKGGDLITSTRIVDGRVEGDKITLKTNSGSEYELGVVAEDYEAQFPDARNRVIKNFVK